MRIAVLSDTHMRQLTDNFQKQMEKHLKGVDLVLHAGDWVGVQVLGFFNTYPLNAVYGNMDDPYIKEVLPSKQVLKLNGFRIGLIHGWGEQY